ncbi:enoyl-CoA hydratase [Cupriavidus sp. USMAHM13]|uniref:enoyl-CoA hydratase/isomerase family protein n=1 Tax=Cupriavidus sp. USMAHM13 TaxID=1389192 RepID=UPI0008A68F19|nr:enoyl-CoA hydratase/isomerase family protein [Cupriavidus sp. USMAHM13]AOZ03931.1 enoyl-CoA hydratase [Cupriavidus sp. USMAHM13]
MNHAPASAAEPLLRIARQGPLTHLTLNRPARGNALSAALVAALAAAVEACHTDGTRLLAIEGAGKHFCTGFDLEDLEQESDDSLLARFVRVELLLQAVHAAPFVSVALVQGRAMGAGADLVAACARRWAAPGSSFAFPGAGFGLVLGTERLAALVGATCARSWIAGGGAIGSEDALRAGLVDAMVVPDARAAGLAALLEQACRLDASTQAAIHAAALGGSAGAAARAGQLADLVRSAARPGLKHRIAAYRAATRR